MGGFVSAKIGHPHSWRVGPCRRGDQLAVTAPKRRLLWSSGENDSSQSSVGKVRYKMLPRILLPLALLLIGANSAESKYFFKKIWTILGPVFHLFSSFQTNITIFTANKCQLMSIQYMVLGFEPTTFGT